MVRSKKLKILILGGTRFIGFETLKVLSKQNHLVDIISRKKIPKKFYNKHFRFDLSNLQNLKNQNYDFVIDFISTCKDIKKITNLINFKKLIFISSVWVLKIKKKNKFNKLKYEKKDYLLNKINCENKYISILKNKLIILRIPIVFGKNDPTKRLSKLYKSIKKNLDFKSLSNKKNINFVYLHDVVEVIKKLINSKTSQYKNNVFYISNDEYFSMRDLIKNLYCLKFKSNNSSKKYNYHHNYFYNEKKFNIPKNKNFIHIFNIKCKSVFQLIKSIL